MNEQEKTRILAIETSCDESAISIVEASGGLDNPTFNVLGDALNSQIEIHKEYGGVFPALAKREHQKALVPLLKKARENTPARTTIQSGRPARHKNESARLALRFGQDSGRQKTEIQKILEREPVLLEQFEKDILSLEKPNIDYIAVTYGPGLEPALWVGINFARALSYLWGIPLIPVNHMEGHIASVLLDSHNRVTFPALALLVSGGHTELDLVESWGHYKHIGQTRDDAIGEAFDKVARLLDLPYPGGPEISKLASLHREEYKEYEPKWDMPLPMIHSGDFDFSFSGIKTAVLYKVRDAGKLNDRERKEIAREFEDAVIKVIVTKTKKAIEEYGVQSLIVGGGVIANKKLREEILNLHNSYPYLSIHLPHSELATDNAVMIAMSAYLNTCEPAKEFSVAPEIRANGNAFLSKDE